MVQNTCRAVANLVFAVLAFSLTSLVAQTVDTAVLGTVTDVAGAAVGSATIIVTQPSTGLTKTVMTGSDGNYELRYLLPGEYVVEVKANGFNAERRSGINIQLGQQAKLDFKLEIGTVQQLMGDRQALSGEAVSRLTNFSAPRHN